MRPQKNHFYLLVVLFVLISGCSQDQKDRVVVIDGLFIKLLPPGQTTAAGYMRIKNYSKISQSLNYMHSPMAEHIEVHRNIYEGGMMQMRPVKKLTVNPGEEKILEPGGFHLMIMGIYDNLKPGDTFPVTFEFETGVVITKDVEVRPHG